MRMKISKMPFNAARKCNGTTVFVLLEEES